MEIINYKKTKNNQYELTFDTDATITLYEDTIIKYNLLYNKNLNEKEIDNIIKENNKLEAYYLSIKHLSNKMRTSLEIKKYLQKKSFSNIIIENTINILIKQGYLNDDKYIESYINDQYHLTNNGPDKIKNNLIKLGIEESKIFIDKDFSSKIKNMINKKIKVNNKLSTNALKLSITNYLFNLGYKREMFQKYLENITANDYEFIKKDYEKLYNKYKNKYDEYKLKMFLKDKLYQKGYSFDLINKVVNEGD